MQAKLWIAAVKMRSNLKDFFDLCAKKKRKDPYASTKKRSVELNWAPSLPLDLTNVLDVAVALGDDLALLGHLGKELLSKLTQLFCVQFGQ
jgi:hypothetical protein